LSEPWANKRTPKPILTVEGFPLDALAEDGQLAFEHKVAEETLSLRATSSPLILEGRRIGTSVVISDETEYHRLLEELTHLARRDTLTGLNNRATFFNDAALSFDLIGREGGVPGCALMLDIDFFKEVNDTYGHSEGDDVLRYIGKVLLKRFRHTDICGRYGGEEFCVWMPATSLANASKVAEEIRGIVQKHSFKLHCGSYSISVSIGIASSVDAAPGDFEDLMRKADIALYEAKNTGRNRVCIYNEDSMLANRSRGADAGNEEEEASAEGGGIA
jgi:diguanylate cyclase (GGDEF)-like protein